MKMTKEEIKAKLKEIEDTARELAKKKSGPEKCWEVSKQDALEIMKITKMNILTLIIQSGQWKRTVSVWNMDTSNPRNIDIDLMSAFIRNTQKARDIRRKTALNNFMSRIYEMSWQFESLIQNADRWDEMEQEKKDMESKDREQELWDIIEYSNDMNKKQAAVKELSKMKKAELNSEYGKAVDTIDIRDILKTF